MKNTKKQRTKMKMWVTEKKRRGGRKMGWWVVKETLPMETESIWNQMKWMGKVKRQRQRERGKEAKVKFCLERVCPHCIYAYTSRRMRVLNFLCFSFIGENSFVHFNNLCTYRVNIERCFFFFFFGLFGFFFLLIWYKKV